MTLKDFISVYGGGACITIKGYCNEKYYDYYRMPDSDVEDFSGNNPNHYIPSCLEKEPWWSEVKGRRVEEWKVIGGGVYDTELSITLEQE